MSTQTLERPVPIRLESYPVAPSAMLPPVEFEPNFGPNDQHAIRALFGIMVGIFMAALIMYASIALLAT